MPHLITHLQPQVQAISTRALSRTANQREDMPLALEELVDNKTQELNETTEQGKMQLQRDITDKTDELRQTLQNEGDAMVENVVEELGSAVDGAVQCRGHNLFLEFEELVDEKIAEAQEVSMPSSALATRRNSARVCYVW